MLDVPPGLTFTWWGCCLRQRHKPFELGHSFLFCSCVYFCLYGQFNCISFRKFSRRLIALSLCPSGFNSALLVLSTMFLCMKVPCSPDIISSGWLGSKHQSALLTCSFGWQVVCDWKLNLLYNSSSYRSSMNPVVRACAYLTGVLGQWVSVRVFSIYQRQNCNQL